ncbi:MAG: glycosyltransferase [Hungatella sp.]|nr:glycosyltransferase [Hungatella sp.]
MTAGNQLRISQCMIVKDEEQNIERALSWGKEILWEQIVVDTGSTDRTVELAEKAGAKVYSFLWTDDFAAAKNFALDKARGDWIAFLDADEYLTPQDARKIFQVLKGLPSGKFDGISMGCQNLDEQGRIFSSGTLIRFFRNTPQLRYRRRIHEQLEAAGGRKLHIGDVTKEISIFHTGYQNKVLTEKTKEGRNFRLIAKELEDHPDSYEMMGYMGDEYFSNGDYGEAEKWYYKAIDHMPAALDEYDQRSAYTFTKLLKRLMEKEGKNQEEIERVYRQAVSKLPGEADFDYLVGRFFASEGQTEKAADHLEAAVEKLNRYGCNNRALLLGGELLEAYDLLVRCCYETGHKEKCTSYAVTYLKYNKYNMAVLARLLKVLLPEHGMDSLTASSLDSQENRAILGFLSKIYDFSLLKDRLFLVKAAQMSERSGFAEYGLNRLFTVEEREQIGM